MRKDRSKRDGESETRDLLTRWWAQALAAGWILAVITIYFRLQLTRLAAIAAGQH